MSCDAYRELLDGYLEDTLDEVRRTGFRSHLESCPECRTFAVAAEPTLVLSLAGRHEPSAERVEANVAAVMAGIRHEQLKRRLRASSRRSWLAAAAVVLLSIVAAAAWWLNGDGAVQEPALQADAHELGAVEAPVTAATPEIVEPPPRVEIEMTQEEVRVYQYAIGDDQSTGAVFIVNPSMEL